MRAHLALASLLALPLAACGDDGGATTTTSDGPVATVTASLASGGDAAAGSEVPALVLTATDAGGAPVGGAALTLTVAAGGGRVASATVTTDDRGEAGVSWVLGAAPIPNTLHVAAGEAALDLTLVGAIADGAEPTPEDFADVHGYLTTALVEGSTEDLSFGPGGELVLGVPGGLLEVGADGAISRPTLTGDALVGPLGVAHDAAGRLFVADGAGNALRRVGLDGAVTTLVTEDADGALEAPNHVAVGPDGDVFFSDPCKGRVYRADQETGAISGVITMDLPTQGGPNGIALADDGAIYFTTENTALLCGDSDVPLTAPIASLFRTRWDAGAGAFDAPVAVASGVGLFGDGLAFDAEGNLYVIFDTVEEIALDESIVFVLPRGGSALRRFFALDDGRVLANANFGAGAYGETTLYLTLLSVPPFTADASRGLVRIPVGVAGKPLPAE
ncbi:MAG: SMP-30/gluconolactonase/LRE family protein [Deltaproteobacteria bacterium]|nr:SMP-30/gluconolactonase/LRE family protein [Deltaproteobacteria bacterium]